MRLEGQVARIWGAEIRSLLKLDAGAQVGCRNDADADHLRVCKSASRQHLEVRWFAYFEICTVHELSEIVRCVVVE